MPTQEDNQSSIPLALQALFYRVRALLLCGSCVRVGPGAMPHHAIEPAPGVGGSTRSSSTGLGLPRKLLARQRAVSSPPRWLHSAAEPGDSSAACA